MCTVLADNPGLDCQANILDPVPDTGTVKEKSMCDQPQNPDYKKNIVDVMMESQEYRSLIFHIASIPAQDRDKLERPAILEKSWDMLIEGNNADYAILNYYARLGLLK